MPPRRGHEDKTARTHIPRPPNAFILFRSSFIRSNHVPGQVEGNHSTLSKIIGLCWKALPPHERGSWEEKARLAQAEHRTLYPDWRWTPEANALGKKRVRKRKKSDADDEHDSSEPQPKRKSRAKDKGKARERDPSSEHDEDARVAKIADLLKEGKTGAVLTKALEEWQATQVSSDPRPTKKRRPSRKQDINPQPEPQLQSQDSSPPLPAPAPEPLPSSSSSLQAPLSPSHPSRLHVFRRSPSAPTDGAELCPPNTHPESSHTPSPTAFYPNSRPVQPPPTITWSQNTTPASYPASQPNYPQWWNSTSPAPASSSPFGPCYDSPQISTDGLGYAEGTRFDREYEEQFGQLPRTHDGSDGAQWSRNPGRNGICTVISDPLPECDESPTTSSPASFPPPVDVVSPTIISPSPSTQFYTPNGNISPSAPNPGFVPSTYSSLTGWAGEFGDHAGSASSSGWFSAGWQGPQRLSSSWGQQSDISDSPPIPESSHHNHKITYLDHSTLRLHPPAPSASNVLHQLGSSTPTHSPSS